ncbi:MAG: polysaccharide deacetylase family protein [Solirubrobacteraceae bacterium]
MDLATRRARRAERARSIRRRRRIAASSLALALCAAVAVALAVTVDSGGSGGSGGGSGAHVPVGSTSARASVRSSSRSVRARTAAGPPGTEPVPILMYHVIAEPPPGAPFPGLYVPPAELNEQMRALKHAGWHAVTLDQVWANWTRGVSLGPGKPIVISFDNGYQSQFTQALPILRSLGWVGVENIQLSGLPPSQGGFGKGQIQGLVAAGWELDTQGFSHADLITLDARQLHYQVAVARAAVQRRFHVAVNWFCYPSGHYNATVVAAVKAAGYTGSTTVIPGWARRGEDPYRMHRLRVLGGTSATQLLALIDGVRSDPPAPASYGGA